MANNAKMIDPSLYQQAGINPEMIHRPSCNGVATGISTPLKDNLFRQLTIKDRQTAVNRYQWYNLPVGMSSQDLERMLYKKGNLAFFYLEELNQFFILPYAQQGGIDCYGRMVSIHPIPLATTGADDNKEKKAQIEKMIEYFTQTNLEVQYDVVLPDELMEDPDRYITKSAVLLHDYTGDAWNGNVVAREGLQSPLLDVMSNIIPYLNTALMNSTGVNGVRVNNADEALQVSLASNAVQGASLNGEKWVAMKGQLEFQDLATKNIAQMADYLQSLQALDNFRLSLYGLENGGVFEKKAHTLQSEQEMNAGGSTSLVLKDGLDIRQRFCNIVNSIWGIGIWCEPTEQVMEMDMNGDGVVAGNEGDSNNVGTNENEGGSTNDNE